MKEKLMNNSVILILSITAVVIFFLKYVSPLVAPALAAMLFVTIFGPLLKFFQEKYHIRRRVGSILLLILAGAVVSILLWVLISWLLGSLPGFLGNLGDLEMEIYELIDGISRAVGRLIGMDVEFLKGSVSDLVNEAFDGLRTKMMPQMFAQSLQYFKNIARIGMFLITFVIAAILLAKDYDDLMNRLLDREDCRIFLEVMCGIIRYIATYVKAQLIIMSLLSLLCAVVLGIAGVEFGVLWGILGGILDALPFIGTGVVLVPIAITQFLAGNYVRTVVCLILYVSCLFLRELLEPKLIGKKIGVNPLLVLLSLYAGIKLFGAWGIIKGPLGFVIIYQTFFCIREQNKNNFLYN